MKYLEYKCRQCGLTFHAPVPQGAPCIGCKDPKCNGTAEVLKP